MIHRFATYEEAGIYAGAMRSDGYYAAILDENMGFIYGPIAVGGFRVIVSDEPVEDEEPLAPTPAPMDPAFDAIRLMVVAFVSLGILIEALLFMKYPNLFFQRFIGGLFCIALPCAISCLLIPLVEPMTRAFRDERSPFGICVRALVVLHVVGEWLFMLGAFAYAIWCEAHSHCLY